MLRQKADEEMIPPPRSCSLLLLKGRWGRQEKNTNRQRDDTKRRAQHLLEEGRDCSGTEEKGPLPGMFMEGFQEEVVFTRLWDRKKRKREIPLSGRGWNTGRKE